MSASKHKRNRPTIGLLTFGIKGTVAVDMWLGVSDAARGRDANALCFPGGLVGSDTLWASVESNVLYELAGAANVDGLVVWSGAILHTLGLEAAEAFCMRYALPVVSVALPLPGVASLTTDNYQPVRQVIDHLVEVHGCGRIGFLRGPENFWEANERYRAYVDALGAHGLALDSALVAPGGYGYDKPAGVAAAELLLRERGLRPGVDFDALVAANDEMALGLLGVLQERGVRVPDEVAVTGFNDQKEASAVTPPLTTVRYSFYEMGRRAAELLLDQIEGRKVPDQTTVPLRLVVRESCGCLNPAVVYAAVEAAAPVVAEESVGAILAGRRSQIFSDMVETFASRERGVVREQVERLLDSFIAGVRQVSSDLPNGFLRTLDGILREEMVVGGGSSISAGEHVAVWQDVVSTLRRCALPHLTGEALIRAANLWEQARVMIGQAERRAEAQRALREEERADLLQEINQVLAATPDLVGLTQVLARELPRLGIPSAYLSLYEDAGDPTGWSGLVMGYNEAGPIEVGRNRRRFPSCSLVPDGALPRHRPYSMVVGPLYYLERQLGLVLWEMGLREGEVYHTLRGEISSALQGVLLLEQVAHRAVQLQTAAEISRSAGTVLEPGELIQQAVELIRERFDLYHVGLYLIEESGEAEAGPPWAVLRAGAGEAGRELLKRGHRLRVDEGSVLGRCLAHRQAQVVVDVGDGAALFDTSLLPDTRSEMMLPLLSRDRMIGVLDIRSVERGAFGEEEIAVFETMAGQLANAIENARLYQEAVEGRRLAEEASRLKSRFLSTVSHELRTPLNVITGLSTVLLREGQEVGSAKCVVNREDVEHMYASAQHLDGLIRDVLDLARSEVGQLRLVCEPLDLGEVMQPVLAIGQQLVRDKGLAWRVDIPEGVPQVWGDRTRLRQVALNLVNNAVKFTAQGEVALSAVAEGDRVVVSVRDTGLGIPLDEQEVIFDEFRQSERTTARGYGGLGLGLAICKRLVELHGGEIGVRSSGEEGGGSEFYFALPALGHREAFPDAMAPLTEVRQVLLLVKDEWSGSLLRDRLAGQGFEVAMHQVGESWEQDWQTWLLGGVPEAVVLDREVASEQGWEILKALKENPAARCAPVVFYTLVGDESGGSMLAIDYLTKPMGTAELVRALECQGLLGKDQDKDKKVLVVDDVPTVLEMHARIVEAQSPRYRVLRASNGREALEVIRRERPDLVLLDLMMPELDGFGVLEAMRDEETSRDIPVIVLTGQVLTEEDMARLNRGAAGVLGKGLFSVEETLERIEETLAHRRKLNVETQQIVRRAMAYIHTHYPEPISLKEIAAYVGLSEQHLIRSFRGELGITPIDYLKRYRIRQAKTLLETSGASVTQVALEVGFSDGNYFARVFRRETGVSPSAYRRGER